MKYRYEKVIQGNYGYGWDDLTAYDCDSTGFIKDKAKRDEYKSDRKAYAENEPNPHRSITRRIKIEDEAWKLNHFEQTQSAH